MTRVCGHVRIWREHDGGEVAPPRGGGCVTLLEVIALLMLIIAVVNLVLKISKKK